MDVLVLRNVWKLIKLELKKVKKEILKKVILKSFLSFALVKTKNQKMF